MQKPVFLFSIVSLFLAAAGLAVRLAELSAAFDPISGLTVFSPLTVVMVGLSLIAALFYIFFSRKVKLPAQPRDYISAFQPGSSLTFIVSIIAFLVMCAGAYLCYLTGLAKVSAAASGVFALLAVLSGASYFTLSFNALKRRGHGDMMLSSVIDVIFLCYWTIIYYRQQAANPVLIEGMYSFLGLCSATLAFFYATGFTAQRPAPRSYLLFAGLAIFFCIIALANASSIAYGLFYLVLIVRFYIGVIQLIRNSEKTESSSGEAGGSSDKSTI